MESTLAGMRDGRGPAAVSGGCQAIAARVGGAARGVRSRSCGSDRMGSAVSGPVFRRHGSPGARPGFPGRDDRSQAERDRADGPGRDPGGADPVGRQPCGAAPAWTDRARGRQRVRGQQRLSRLAPLAGIPGGHTTDA